SLISTTRILNVLVPDLISPASPFVNVRSLISATRRSELPVMPLRTMISFFVGSGTRTGVSTWFGKNGSLPARYSKTDSGIAGARIVAAVALAAESGALAANPVSGKAAQAVKRAISAGRRNDMGRVIVVIMASWF